MSDFRPVCFGKYILLETLATGGMAQLYKAKITGIEGFEKLVAIKMILPHLAKDADLVTSFIDEAKFAALLNHENNVQIYDFGNVDDSYFICMEYLSGKDLRAIAKTAEEKSLAISLEYALYICSRICAGLDYAHMLKDLQGRPLNLIHRDISPQNIFVTYEGAVKILDFGIAKAATQSTMTQFGMIKGKVAYMSPEQAAGEVIDQRSDIFSTGILLYEMVTGARMFTGESTMQILAKVRETQYEPPESALPGLSLKVYAIIRRALTKEPDERYQSCGDMLADIEECMKDLSMRPSARGFAQYMKELFREEIITEEKEIQKLTGVKIAQEIESGTISNSKEGMPEKSSVIQDAARKKQKGKPWIIYGGIGGAIVVVLVFILFWQPGKKQTSPLPKDAGAVSGHSVDASSGKANVVDSTKTPDKDQGNVVKAKALIDEASKYVKTDPRKSISLLAEATRLDPLSAKGYSQLGFLYTQQKEYKNSIHSFQKALGLDPKSADICFNLGYAYAMEKEYAKAAEMFVRAVDLAPPYIDEALFNLAMAQVKLGKKKEAVMNLEKALQLNPKNTLAKDYLRKLK